MRDKKLSLVSLLIILTILLIFAEVSLVIANFYALGMHDVIANNSHALNWFDGHLLIPILQYFAAQLLIYGAFIYLVWYVATTLSLSRFATIALFATIVLALFEANSYFCPHSFFASVVTYSPMLLLASLTVVALVIGYTLFMMFKHLLRGISVVKHMVFLSTLGLVLLASFYSGGHQPVQSPATAEHPNIFIIGFDALRTDYLSFYDGHGGKTPHLDDFLKQAVVFNDAYTPAARTYASWVTILTGKHPLHSGAREDNIAATSLSLGTTLPQHLQQAGYHTVYVSDDNRFNNVNQTIFGFDEISGPSGNIADFIINLCNDFPLSNLMIASPIGYHLFPELYANHGSPHNYQPEGYITQLEVLLRKQGGKPLFLASHFNVTGWPFYYFNDREPGFGTVNNLKNVVQASDKQFGAFIQLLKKYGLLEHAIFVVLSDHGLTTGMPHERLVSEDRYHGNKRNMKKLTYYRYADKAGVADLGIDTSLGYGSDVLSVMQNHTLLGIRGFGVSMPPHVVTGRVTLMDVMPTVLAAINIPVATPIDGISLHPYLLGKTHVANVQPLFLESCFSNAAFMRESSITGNDMESTFSYFQIDSKTGLVSFKEEVLSSLYRKKQHAVWSDHWFLANYPASTRLGVKLHADRTMTLEPVQMPPYSVLVNTNTGAWTTELSGPFAKTAPVKKLQQALKTFYAS